MSAAEPIEGLPLQQKRRILGIIFPLFNLPLLGLNLYQTYEHFLAGMSWKSWEFTVDLIGIIVSVALIMILPNWVPLYESKYSFTEKGLHVTRFMRKPRTISYKRIDRVELFLREPGPINEEADRYAKDSSERLRKSGLNFVDYTNDESNIALLLSGKEIIMISPAAPKAFLKDLKKKSPKLTAKIVELNARGKTIQELE